MTHRWLKTRALPGVAILAVVLAGLAFLLPRGAPGPSPRGASPLSPAVRHIQHRVGRLTPAPGRGAVHVGGYVAVKATKPALPMTTSTGTVLVGAVERSYQLFAPTQPVAAKIPLLVVLQGRGVSVAYEEQRDGLLPLVQQGKVTVVYPVGIDMSWNAGSCCGPAQKAGVDDLTFIDNLLNQFSQDPTVSTVFLAGFSNGGRMAYRVMCADPQAAAAFAVVDGVSSDTCPGGSPVPLLQIDGTQDSMVAYDSSTPLHANGTFVDPTAVQQVANWIHRDGCNNTATSAVHGVMTLEVWSHCDGGTAVEFATYHGYGHEWPKGNASTPPASQEVWSFFTNPTGRPTPAPRRLR